MSDLDVHEDAQVSAVLELLAKAVRVRVGGQAVVGTFAWPIPLSAITGSQLPALCVYRTTDQQDESVVDVSVETTTIGITYYAPPVSMDRASLRWPLLRRVWRRVMQALRVGFDPAHARGANTLQAAGIAVPAGIAARVQYQLAPGLDGAWVPSFTATATLKVGEEFDWEFDGQMEPDDLDRIHTLATDTDDDQPAFESMQDDDA